VPQKDLNGACVHPCFKKMGGKIMPKRMEGYIFGNTCLLFGRLKYKLGVERVRRPFVILFSKIQRLGLYASQ